MLAHVPPWLVLCLKSTTAIVDLSAPDLSAFEFTMPAGEAQTPAKYPLYLSAVTSPCVWSEFPSPSTVDVWLGVVAGLPSVVRAQEGFVTCSVESVSVQVRLLLSWPLGKHGASDDYPACRWQFLYWLSDTYPTYLSSSAI